MSLRKIFSLIFNITAIVSAVVGLFLIPNLQAVYFIKYFTQARLGTLSYVSYSGPLSTFALSFGTNLTCHTILGYKSQVYLSLGKGMFCRGNIKDVKWVDDDANEDG